MKRCQFLLAFLGFGAAVRGQEAPIKAECLATTSDRKRLIGPCASNFLFKGRVAQNNQCPVCGTMAEPYTHFRSIQNATPEHAAYGESAHLTRCWTCNAAFWQDSVSEK
jgi:uncharacterized protein with PIN domain